MNNLPIFAYTNGTPEAQTMNNRLESYEWTDTGVKFTIQDINKEMHMGAYVASIRKGHNTTQGMIGIEEIIG